MAIKFSARGISAAFRTPQELVEQDAVTLKPIVGGEVIVNKVTTERVESAITVYRNLPSNVNSQQVSSSTQTPTTVNASMYPRYSTTDHNQILSFPDNVTFAQDHFKTLQEFRDSGNSTGYVELAIDGNWYVWLVCIWPASMTVIAGTGNENVPIWENVSNYTTELASNYTEEGGCTVGENSYPNTKSLNDAGISVISDVFGAYDCDADEGLNVKMVDRWAKPTFIPEFTVIQYGHGKISTVEANVPYEVFKSPATTPTEFTPDPNVAYINVSIMGNQYKFNAHTYQKDGKLWIVFETGYPIPAPYARTITFALFPKGAKEKIIMKSDNTMLCHGAHYDGCYAMMTNMQATGFSWNTEEELAAKGYHAVDPIPIPEEV